MCKREDTMGQQVFSNVGAAVPGFHNQESESGEAKYLRMA